MKKYGLLFGGLLSLSMQELASGMGSKPPKDESVCTSPCRVYAGRNYKTSLKNGEVLALVLDQRDGRGWNFESYPSELLEQTPEGHPLPDNPEWTVIYFTARAPGTGDIQMKSGTIVYPPDDSNWTPSKISVEIE